METNMDDENINKNYAFKIDFIVWKHTHTTWAMRCLSQFKIDFIVWKLNSS